MPRGMLNDDRLFPADPNTRPIAQRLYAAVRNLPIVSPHGHTQARWFAGDEPFTDPARLFITPDHYVFRMLYSQGVSLDDLGIGSTALNDPRRVWRIFAQHYYLFRGTPTRLWLDFAFQELFGLSTRLSPENADEYYDTIVEKLQRPEFRPRALSKASRLRYLQPRTRLSIRSLIIKPFAPRPSKDASSQHFVPIQWSIRISINSGRISHAWAW